MRKIRIISVIFIGTVLLNLKVNGQEKPGYVKTDSGIEVSVSHSLSGIKKIRLQPVTDQVIHIIAVAANEFPDHKSLMSIQSANAAVYYSATTLKDLVVLKTNALKVEVSTETGLITYRDLNDKILLSQSKLTDMALVPRLFNGEPSYQVSALFEAQENEAYYGLGQHQQGIVNYRGRRVDLIQYNTEIAVPFVVSNKGYGLLWDNYSITRAGDVRDYQPLNALRLFSKNNTEGWITASYAQKKRS